MALGDVAERDGLLHDLLAKVTGKNDHEIRRLRRARRSVLEKANRITVLENSYLSKNHATVVTDMALKEAALRDDFDPDLVIMSEMQYKIVFDIPAGVGMRRDSLPDAAPEGDIERVTPPKTWYLDNRDIEVVPSDEARGILLVESDSL